MTCSLVGVAGYLFLVSACSTVGPGQPGAVVSALLAIPRVEAVSAPSRRPVQAEVAGIVLPTPPLRPVERRATAPPVAPHQAVPRSLGERRPQAGVPGIHPAVVRVVAPGQGSVSYGSGTLVDVNGAYGLVITNYHVINEATGNISVVFPDGFYSLATVRKIDREWDLAALSIKRPSVAPVKLAANAPQPGEPLTIAGYGSGNYRAVAGQCTQYVAPGMRMPFEMVELAASARQGDSGGPILNSRGELAGVLFGEGGGRTAGSYCGRVQWFLTSLIGRAEAKPPIPGQPELHETAAQEQVAAAVLPVVPVRRHPENRAASKPSIDEEQVCTSRQFSTPRIRTQAPEYLARGLGAGPLKTSLAPTVENVEWSELVGTSITDQAKTFLAILGCCALLMFSLKALSGEG